MMLVYSLYLTGVRSEKITLGDPKPGSRSSDVLNLVHPKVVAEDERVWSFPHDSDTNDNSDVRPRYDSPVRKVRKRCSIPTTINIK